MLDEEVIIKDAKNSSERFLLINTILMVLVPALLLGCETETTKTLFVALGILAPINVIVYRRVWIDALTGTIRLYVLSLIPFVISAIIAIIGTFTCLLSDNNGNVSGFFRLVTDNNSLFVSTTRSFLNPTISELTLMFAAACAVSMFFITESRYIIRRIFLYCAVGAAVFAMFGFLYKLPMLSKMILPVFGDETFSTFRDKSQWSAFAITWLGAALSIVIYSSQRYRLATFVLSLKFIAIVIVSVLLLSVLIVGSTLEILLALILVSLGFLFVCLDTIPTKGNLERHYTSKFIRSKYKKLKLSIAPLSYFVIFVLASLGTVFSAMSLYEEYQIKVNAAFNESAYIQEEALELVGERPLFGWGTASFKNIYAFKQGADLGDSPYTSPNSDLLKKLVENGYIGLFLVLITPFVFFVRWLFKFNFSRSGIVLFATTLSIIVLSIFESPLQSAAVLQSFWLVLMGTFKWEDCNVR